MNFLTEDPDITFPNKSYTNSDAVTFGIIEGVYFESPTNISRFVPQTHLLILQQLVVCFAVIEHLEEHLQPKEFVNVLKIYTDNINCYNLTTDNFKLLRRKIKDFKNSTTYEDTTFKQARNLYDICGRYWCFSPNPVISVWSKSVSPTQLTIISNALTSLSKYKQSLDNFKKGKIETNISNYKFDLLGSNTKSNIDNLVTFDDVKNNTSTKLSKTEEIELRKKQHFDPSAKREIFNNLSTADIDNIPKPKSAISKFREIIGDNVNVFDKIYNKVFSESPDSTYGAYCCDSDAVTIAVAHNMYFEVSSAANGNNQKYNFYGHGTIVEILIEHIEKYLEYKTDRTTFLKSIKRITSTLSNALSQYNIKSKDINFGNVYRMVLDYMQNSDNITLSIRGRFWTESKILSFWEKMSEITPDLFNIVQSGIEYNNQFRIDKVDLYTYRFDVYDISSQTDMNNLLSFQDFISFLYHKDKFEGYIKHKETLSKSIRHHNINKTAKMSTEERRKAEIEQHLNPLMKKKLWNDRFRSRDIDTPNHGYNTTAEFNTKKTFGDSYSPFKSLCDKLLVD